MSDLTTAAAERLAVTRQVHAAAAQRHQEATNTAGRAGDRREAAARQRQELLDDAAAGGRVVEVDLKRATEALRDATDSRDLHSAIARSARAAVDRAEIDLLAAGAEDHASRANLARAAACEAAVLVDQAVAASRTALGSFLDRLGDLRTLNDEAVQHSAHALPQALAANEALRNLHPSQHPRFVDVPTSRPALAVQVVSDTGRGLTGGGMRIVHSVAQYASVLAPVAATPGVVQATQAA